MPRSGRGTCRAMEAGDAVELHHRRERDRVGEHVVMPNTDSNERDSAGVVGSTASLVSKYARSVMNTFHGRSVPTPARNMMAYVMPNLGRGEIAGMTSQTCAAKEEKSAEGCLDRHVGGWGTHRS